MVLSLLPRRNIKSIRDHVVFVTNSLGLLWCSHPQASEGGNSIRCPTFFCQYQATALISQHCVYFYWLPSSIAESVVMPVVRWNSKAKRRKIVIHIDVRTNPEKGSENSQICLVCQTYLSEIHALGSGLSDWFGLITYSLVEVRGGRPD